MKFVIWQKMRAEKLNWIFENRVSNFVVPEIIEITVHIGMTRS